MGSYYTMLYLPLFSHYMLCLCEDILSHLIFIRTKCVCAQSLPTLCNPMDYSLPGSSLHGIFQAKILQWVAISYSRGTYLLHLLHWQVDSLPLSHLETSRINTVPFYGCITTKIITWCDHLVWWCDHSPRARYPGMWSQVGLRKDHYEQS